MTMAIQMKSSLVCGGVLLLLAALTPAAASKGSCSGLRANPSVYNWELGGKAAKVISDGRLLFNIPDVYDADETIVARALEKNYQSTKPIVFENNILYMEWDDNHTYLFETGNSGLSDTAGWLFDQLDVEGIHPAKITDIFISHGHFDHIAGLLEAVDSSKLKFPNARVHLAKAEYDYWMADEVDFSQSILPQENQDFLTEVAQDVFTKVKNQLVLFDLEDEAEVAPGVTPFSVPHHTPGNVAYIVDTGTEKMLNAADAFGIESTSINNPWFVLKFDSDAAAGPPGRVSVLQKCVDEDLLVLGFHGTFPGLGHIVENDLSFDFKAVNWEMQSSVHSRCPADAQADFEEAFLAAQ